MNEPKLPPPQVLIYSDDPLTSWPLRHALDEQGYVTEACQDLGQVYERLGQADLVVLNLSRPPQPESELLVSLSEVEPDVPVIVLARSPTVLEAVELMSRGADHYARRDLPAEELVLAAGSALERTTLAREVRRFVLDSGGADGLLGLAPATRAVRETLVKIAASPTSTVLITGESGTGKSLAARTIHACSSRSSRPFMNITCSALPEHLLESELFGHERGAFTDAKQRKLGLLELADGGTVFLDELGEMSIKLQAKLLRFLEERSFRRVGGSQDVRPELRVIAATNRDLEHDVQEGRFRADLFFRLAVIRVHLPPLRERQGDATVLAKYFLHRARRAHVDAPRGFAPEALERLEAHDWPGNVRELRNTIERVAILATGPRVERADLPRLDRPQRGPSLLVLPPGGLSIKSLERELVVQALERTGGNQTRAASLLGMTRDQIRYRIAKFKLAETG